MVYSDIKRLATKFSSLSFDSTGMEPGLASPSSSLDNEIGQQNNQNATVVPPEEALLKLCERTKYQIMQENGQRRYGPPPNWTGIIPSRGCEVFVGKIPRDCFEDELVPIFEKVGRIYMFRLMMDFSGTNRGYGFCIYTNRDDCRRAVQELDNFEIRKGKMLGVCLSVDNCRLFVGGIPKTKTKCEIMVEMKKVTEGVKDVIVYPSAADKTKNRGFAFVEYDSHKAAAMARRKLIPGRIQLWGHQIAVDWAEPEREVDEDVMSKVKILYVRNLMLSTSEEHLRDCFNQAAGCDGVERVKKIRDYAFVHFKEREQAMAAMHQMSDAEIEGSRIEVTFAKPVDKTDNVRYTRSGAKNILTQAGLTYAAIDPITLTYYPHLAAASAPNGQLSPRLLQPTMTSPATAAAIAAATSRASSPLRSAFRSRGYRNAAGSRSAGQRSTPTIPGYMRDKKYLVEVLEDFCNKYGWGSPNYHVIAQDAIDTSTGAKVNSFIGKVSLPSINGSQHLFTANRLTTSPEEARVLAAECALLQLGLQPNFFTNATLLDPHFAAAMAAANFAHVPMMHPNMADFSAPTLLYDPTTMMMTTNAFFNPAVSAAATINPAALTGTEIYTPY